MLRKILYSSLLGLVLLSAACSSNSADPTKGVDIKTPEGTEIAGGSAESAEGVETNPEGNEITDSFAESALSEGMQLVVGTLLMEETDLAVDAEMAEALLPYWKMYRSLAESDTAAPEEMESVLKQIWEVMTSGQRDYIAELEITQETSSTLMEDLGIFSQSKGEDGGEDSGFRPEGVQPGSGGGRGGFGETGGNVDPEMRATMQAEREERGGGMMGTRTILPLVEELVSILEGKASE